MKRQVNFNEISDGRKYTSSAMVRLGCKDCEGCSACCHQMESAILDPWDIYMLTTHLRCGIERLLQDYLELSVHDGLIVPQLKMAGTNQACGFLNEQGRCGIHAFRPGVCRLFPLGRIYEDGTFFYFLQIHECRAENRSKVKIEKWLGIPQLSRYENYICQWHALTERFCGEFSTWSEEEQKQRNLLVLQTFFMTPYALSGEVGGEREVAEGRSACKDTDVSAEDFYTQFEERLRMIYSQFGWGESPTDRR